MATSISLDDLDAIGRTASKSSTKKKKKTIKAKSTAKPAKSVSTPTKAKKVKIITSSKVKKKKTEKFDPDAIALDAASMYADIAAAKEQTMVKTKKKKKDVVEETIKKKKKKKTGLALPSANEGRDLDAQMQDVLAAIPDAVKQENDQLTEYQVMFTKLRRMARICERLYFAKKQSRDVYALMKIYDQMREIIADMRALRDVGQLGDTLNAEVLGPLAQANATSLIGFHQAVNAWAKANMPEHTIANFREASDIIVRKCAKDMEQNYHNSLTKTVEVFG